MELTDASRTLSKLLIKKVISNFNLSLLQGCNSTHFLIELNFIIPIMNK